MTFRYRIAYLMLLAHLSKFKLFYVVACREDSRISNFDDNFPQTDCLNEVNSKCYRNYDTDLANLFNFAVDRRRSKNYKSKSKRISSTPFPCPCEVIFGLVDFGNSIYPRYAHSGICKPGTCGDRHLCQPKGYKITVLRRRDSKDELSEDFRLLKNPNLPKSLKENWVAYLYNIVIDCKCIPFEK
ncbi:hypothetical protein HUJ05_001627 [Dendroctonus ponderosae]|nr:hypothetical protein HUJ05_001627 [Dendroctonus ponderosae]